MVLIRRDLKAARQALIELRRAGKTVLVSFKETGAAQIASLMDSSSRLKLVREICRRADGALAATPEIRCRLSDRARLRPGLMTSRSVA